METDICGMEEAQLNRLRAEFATLAEELVKDAAERSQLALFLPNKPAYDAEHIRLETAARHQRRAATRIRRLLNQSREVS